MALSVVYTPQDATTSPAKIAAIDIVAVHGLGGDAIDTWTHPKSKAFWLKDFLPQQVPDARIMTFGYNAHAAFGQSTAERGVGGGIVVKQALFQARLESRYQSIKDATIGLIFLGTPHRGSDKATYGKVLANVVQCISHKPPARLLSALQTNSDVLLQLTTNFRFQLPDYEVYSFFELRPIKGLSSLIVEKYSALLETNHEEQIPVDADHNAMCKFETESDDTFEKVYKRVQRMKNNPRRITNEQSVSNNKYFELPHLLSPVFTGRNEVLECLTASFATRSPLQRQHQRRFVLFGLGGSGKTQICLKYVQDQRERYWGIFWVDASTDDSIKRSFTQLARILQVDENVDCMKRTLANSVQAWLLIFDNADDPSLNLAPYFPAGNRGDIIITSRNPQCQHYNTVGWREVGPLSPQDSMSLLNKTVYGMINPLQVATEESKKITERLGHLALAIVQAGAYIRETSCSLREYLEIYQRRKRDLLYLPTHLGTDYRYSVYTTWQISVDMIESKQDRAAHHALRLLGLLGFYHHDQIPVQMFYKAWDRSQSTRALDYLPWADTVSDFLDYRQAVRASITLLASFSLITKNADASISLHPLVHEWCRDRTSEDDEQQLNYQRSLSLLTSSVNEEFTSEDYTFRRSLVSHVHEFLRLRDQLDNVSKEDKIYQWSALALVLAENGWTKDALPLTEEVVALQKIKLGADHPDTLRSMHNLAIQYSEAGRRTEALQLTEEVVPLQKIKLGAGHPDTLRSMHNLAIRYSEAGRRLEALQLTEEVVALQKIKLGADHPDTLGSMHSLAIRYNQAGRAEALQLTEEVVALRKSKLGPDHPDTLRSMHSLSIRYSQAGRAEALQLTTEVLELRKSKLGPDHPDTLGSERLLATLRQERDESTPVHEASTPPKRSTPKLPRWFRSGKR
ncbi:hypothetical protein H2202_008361 [Exophiala xenobiotica]|nr:hypothetical protein H2202_008361 [Exophiala xenobiotica]